jgi:hypothetical protein
MRSREEVASVLELVRAGWSDCEIERETGIPRPTILGWRQGARRTSTGYEPAPFQTAGTVRTGRPRSAPPHPWVAALGRVPGAELVNGTPYPRYHLCNVSADIRGIFGRACDQLGIEWRPNNRWSLSVARRGSVALLDEFVGPKR